MRQNAFDEPLAVQSGVEMMRFIAEVVSLASRLSARLGSALAWYLWFHPHGRANTRLPAGSESFALTVFDHDLEGYVLGRGEPVLLLHGWLARFFPMFE